MEVIDSTDKKRSEVSNERSSMQALARSMMYGRLALGFRYPDKQVRAALAGRRLYDELQGCCIVLQCGHCVQHLAELRTAPVPEHPEIESTFLASFENIKGDDGFCPLNEGDYRTDVPRGELLVELKALYEHFGLEVAEEEIDLADRIGAELEFMHFLALKEVDALDSGEDPSAYVKAQRDFQADHLRQWIPALAARSESGVPEPFYRSWVELTATYVDHDARTD